MPTTDWAVAAGGVKASAKAMTRNRGKGELSGPLTVEKYAQKRPIWPILREFLDSERYR